MRAVTVLPGKADSLQVTEVPDPAARAGELLVEGLALGVCGTDREIAAGDYGWAPPGADRLVLGHESLGRVRPAPPGSGFAAGDLVVGVVRRPDPVPCGACAHGEFDMCRNGRYTERGIKEIARLRQPSAGPSRPTTRYAWTRAREVGVLMEPTTVVAKAWEQIERIGARAWFEPRARAGHRRGPDRAAGRAARRCSAAWTCTCSTGSTTAPSRELVAGAGRAPTTRATSATSRAQVNAGRRRSRPPASAGWCSTRIADNAAAGIVCLTGVSPPGRPLTIDAGTINREIVLENDVVFGSVNANLRHYRAGGAARWSAPTAAGSSGLITRRVPLARARRRSRRGTRTTSRSSSIFRRSARETRRQCPQGHGAEGCRAAGSPGGSLARGRGAGVRGGCRRARVRSWPCLVP